MWKEERLHVCDWLAHLASFVGDKVSLSTAGVLSLAEEESGCPVSVLILDTEQSVLVIKTYSCAAVYAYMFLKCL